MSLLRSTSVLHIIIILAASLFLALENGQVQCWSDHPAGGYQGSFQAIHTAGDYVSAMATDVDNEFLFTGTTFGYVKVWLMSNYLINEEVDMKSLIYFL